MPGTYGSNCFLKVRGKEGGREGRNWKKTDYIEMLRVTERSLFPREALA